jgi:hypothetical protein
LFHRGAFGAELTTEAQRERLDFSDPLIEEDRMAHKIALGVVDCRFIEGLREADLEAANQLLHERTWRSLCRAGSADAPWRAGFALPRFTKIYSTSLGPARPAT